MVILLVKTKEEGLRHRALYEKAHKQSFGAEEG
jgi:hypothetical protein